MPCWTWLSLLLLPSPLEVSEVGGSDLAWAALGAPWRSKCSAQGPLWEPHPQSEEELEVGQGKQGMLKVSWAKGTLKTREWMPKEGWM